VPDVEHIPHEKHVPVLCPKVKPQVNEIEKL